MQVDLPNLNTAMVIAVGGALVRWGMRVDKNLTKITTALEEVERRLSDHEKRLYQRGD